MPTGDLISASDYNNIRNKVVAVLGSGSGPSGYGQTVQSSAVSTSTTVTKAQWDLLRYDLYNCLFHQTGSVPTLTTVNVGDTIRYGAGNPNNQYDTQADVAVTNRFNLGSGQFLTNSSVASATKTDAWYTQAYVDLTATFSTADQARYFFNSGGQIRVNTSRTGGSSTSQNSSWSTILASAGTQVFGGQLPTSGFTPIDGKNFYRLTNSFQTYYQINASGAYSSNSYRLQARCNVSNNSSGTATVVYIRVLLSDPYTDPPNTGVLAGSFPPEDRVDGTLTTTISEVKATGVLQPSPATGNFTITSPTFSIGSWVAS